MAPSRTRNLSSAHRCISSKRIHRYISTWSSSANSTSRLMKRRWCLERCRQCVMIVEGGGLRSSLSWMMSMVDQQRAEWTTTESHCLHTIRSCSRNLVRRCRVWLDEAIRMYSISSSTSSGRVGFGNIGREKSLSGACLHSREIPGEGAIYDEDDMKVLETISRRETHTLTHVRPYSKKPCDSLCGVLCSASH